ncbi:Hachiman antiphage defense system protein HamA [Sphingobacterium sp. MYb382]|uniref:Hachiman antiphage defense system protein HamA n=1 Tax=Sphingobacterium sp. MYb382 TaxID=2745278 RepID=UPI0030B54274
MPIEGVKQIDKFNCTLYIIETLSEEFKQIIRGQLQGIWSGFAMADSLPEFFSYTNTLESFLERYNTKSDNTKKGMIGELLAHILLNHSDNNLTSLSILKNKEEKSIKKGFDIIYCEIDNDKLWYSEVKSGKSETGREDSNTYNEILLKRAKKGISEMINERRNSLWESALIDVDLMIKEGDGKLNLKKILSKDSPVLKTEHKKNVILISSLYHNICDCINENNQVVFHDNTKLEGVFNDIKVISIQKNTFEAVGDFLSNEALLS